MGLLDDPDAVDGQKERVSIDNVFFNELALMNFKKGEVVEKEFPLDSLLRMRNLLKQ